jgi:hypothetical protein
MTETKRMLELRKQLNTARAFQKQLEDHIRRIAGDAEWVGDVACGWAWDEGAGNTHLTREEVATIVDEQTPEPESAQ